MLTCFLNRKLKLWCRQLTHHIACNYVCSVYTFICFWLEKLWLGRDFFIYLFIYFLYLINTISSVRSLTVSRFWKRACKQPSPESCDMMRETRLCIPFQRFHWNFLPKARWGHEVATDEQRQKQNKLESKSEADKEVKDRVNGNEMCRCKETSRLYSIEEQPGPGEHQQPRKDYSCKILLSLHDWHILHKTQTFKVLFTCRRRLTVERWLEAVLTAWMRTCTMLHKRKYVQL